MLSLQAADMLACETYQEAEEILASGEIRPEFGRKQFQRFNNGRLFAQIAIRDSVERIARRAASDPEGTRQIASLMQKEF